jgi:16S rRNA (cytidine1402-2'-O)-methyltransferase
MGTLFLVATPIGNLGDVTFRAIEVLRAVPLIAAEDTRIARRLLGRYDVATRAVSYHARSGPGRLAELLAHLRGGADLALVTDAGTPAVSDPGMELAAAWATEGGRVEAIPGASSVLAAVAVSGLAGPQWVFEGFLPRSGRARRDRLASIAADERGAVVFEAPGRFRPPRRPGGSLGPARRLVASRLHEQVVRGSLGSSRSGRGWPIPPGEVVIVVAGPPAPPARRPAAAEAFGSPTRQRRWPRSRAGDGRPGPAEAARRVAAVTIPRRRLYRIHASGSIGSHDRERRGPSGPSSGSPPAGAVDPPRP